MNLLSMFSACCITLFSLNFVSHANSDFLTADQAFQLSAESINGQQAKLQWTIAPHYYLYHQQFKIISDNKAIALSLPKGETKNDPTFGKTEVHYNQLTTQISVKPNSSYLVLYQGCSAEGLCYPLQRKTFNTLSLIHI